MDEKELQVMKSKSIFSVASLLFQSSYSAILGFLAFFILTFKSSIALLGIYSTVLASMSFFNYITDLGIGAALIQKKDAHDIDLNSAFFTQLVLVIFAVTIGFFVGPHIINGYKDIPGNAIYLYWSLLISFFLLSLKSIPSVILEKKVEIYKVVLVSSIENTIFYVTIIIMVLMGYTMEALITAVLLRSVIGVITMFIMQPWRPKFMFSVQSMKELLHYGIPFQGNSFLALVKDDLLIIFLGQTLGLGNLGLISFGKKYAEMAVRLVTDNINRVAFPVFARVQDNKELLAKSLMRNLFYGSLIVFPIVIGAMFTFDSGLKLFHGYYAKWNGALWSFYFFSLSTLCVSLMTPFINLFNAVKKVKLSLLFMVLWTCLMWAFIPVATHFLGYNAVAPIFLIVNSTVVFVIWQAKKIVHFSILKELHGIFIGSLLMVAYLGIIRFIAINYLNSPELHLVFSVIGSPIVYGGTILVVYGVETFRNVLRTLRPSSAGGSPLDDQH